MHTRWEASPKCRDNQTARSTDSPQLQRPAAASASSANARPDLVSRPRHPASTPRVPSLATTTLLCLIIFLCYSPYIAVAAAIPPPSEEQSLSFVGADSVILFDRGTPPEPAMRLFKRAEQSGTSSTKSSSTSALATATSQSASPLPSAFDTTLGNNFTSSTCPTFFQNFLRNETFNECVPLSLLLQTSTSFFSVQRSPVRLAQTLSASCSVDFDRCSSVMASLARQIQSSSNCGLDLQAQNPMAMQAYDGFVSYPSLYHAGCLVNSQTGSYCFSDALTNASSPTDSYVYYLPLGVSLPSSTSPSCSQCLRDTMSVFASAATNSSQPVSKVYANAATMIDQTCGAHFVNASIPQASGASSFPAGGGFGLLATIALIVSVMTNLI